MSAPSHSEDVETPAARVLELPRPNGEPSPQLLDALRRFHFDEDLSPTPDLRSLEQLAEAPLPVFQATELTPPLPSAWLWSPRKDVATGARCQPLHSWLESSLPEGEESPSLAEVESLLLSRAKKRPGAKLSTLLEQAREEADNRGSSAPRVSTVFEKKLPQSAASKRLFAREPRLPLRLLVATLRERLEVGRGTFRRRAQELVDGLRERLEHDLRGRNASGTHGLGEELGELGTQFVNAEALADRTQPESPEALPPDRRCRMEEALELLEPWTLPDSGAAPIVLATADVATWLQPDDGCWQLEVDEDPLARAADRFDDLAKPLSAALVAARVGRLELHDAYEPQRHDPALDRFDWQSFHADELGLLPPLIVVVPADRAADRQLVSLSSLLRSRRPIQIMALADPLACLGDSSADSPVELAYLGLSHRTAFVQQGLWSAPEALQRGFDRAVASGRTALHVVTAPVPASGPELMEGAEVELDQAALHSRAHPFLLFDPEADDWADRLELAGNPEIEAAWPKLSIPIRGGSETTLQLPLTFADYVQSSGRHPAEFRLLESHVTSELLLPIEEWLAVAPEQGLGRIPFVWAVVDSQLRQLVLSRRLALACADRLEYWQTLKRLAGVSHQSSAPVASVAETIVGVKAAPQLPAQELATAQRQQLATEVVGRLMQLLLADPSNQPTKSS